MIDKKESIRRLTVLRDFLKDNVKEEDFRMNKWECGTTKCALGWACYIPEFKSLGLTFKMLDGEPAYPRIESCEGYLAGIRLFGITGTQAHYLFDPERYDGVSECWSADEDLPITMQDVLNHIDEVIKEQAA